MRKAILRRLVSSVFFSRTNKSRLSSSFAIPRGLSERSARAVVAVVGSGAGAANHSTTTPSRPYFTTSNPLQNLAGEPSNTGNNKNAAGVDDNELMAELGRIIGTSHSSVLNHAPSTVNETMTARTDAFYAVYGRRPRLLLASWVLQKEEGRREDRLAPSLADVGFDVDISPPSRSPAALARDAVEGDVHVILILAHEGDSAKGGEQVKELVAQLKVEEAEDILVVTVGGAAVPGVPFFPTGTVSNALAGSILDALEGVETK